MTDKDALLKEAENYAYHRHGCNAIVNPQTDDCACGFRMYQRRVTEYFRAADVPSTYELLDYPDPVTAALAEQEWVKCSERLPTEADADENGEILALLDGKQKTILEWKLLTKPLTGDCWRPLPSLLKE